MAALVEDVGVDHCCSHVSVTEDLLHSTDVVADVNRVPASTSPFARLNARD